MQHAQKLLRKCQLLAQAQKSTLLPSSCGQCKTVCTKEQQEYLYTSSTMNFVLPHRVESAVQSTAEDHTHQNNCRAVPIMWTAQCSLQQNATRFPDKCKPAQGASIKTTYAQPPSCGRRNTSLQMSIIEKSFRTRRQVPNLWASFMSRATT